MFRFHLPIFETLDCDIQGVEAQCCSFQGKISTNGLSTYLDDILREIAMGRVELGKDFHEDDTGTIFV